MEVGFLTKPGARGDVALFYDRSGAVTGFRTLTEPELLAQFEGRSYAYFEAEVHDDKVKPLRRIADPDWV